MAILITILFISLLIVIHELGHLLAAKFFGIKVQEFSIGFPPRIWSRVIGETKYSLSALLFGGYVRLSGESHESASELPAEDYKRSYDAQPFWKKSAVIVAGVLMNFIAGWIIFTILFAQGIPQRVAVQEVLPNSPASIAGLSQFDIVTGVSTPDGFSEPKTSHELSALVRQYEGMELTLAIQSQDDNFETKNIQITPRNADHKEGAMGVILTDMGAEKKPILRSLLESFNVSANIITATVLGIVILFANIFSGGGLEGIGGPVAIVQLAVGANQLGFSYFLSLMAVISLSLAAFNIFPFPALDGGRLLFLIIEKIKGSALSKKTEQIANSLGFAILLLLMIFVTANDLMKIF